MKRIKEAITKALRTTGQAIPMIVSVVLIISLINQFASNTSIAKIFTGNTILDPLIGGIIGSTLTGNPITSYVIGGELANNAISITAITAFLIAWVTVGIVQMPIEIKQLGKKFSITRNITAFIFAIIIAILTTKLVTIL